MDLTKKIEIAKKAIESITRHDDASYDELRGAVTQLASFIVSEEIAAKKRRADKGKE